MSLSMNMELLTAAGMKNVALVIDNDEHIRELAQRLLRSRFDAVLCASSGAEAMALCETCTVTHVVVDHDLGEELNGPQLVLQLKAIRPEIERVVLYSGSPIDPTTLRSSIDAFVRKGEDSSELLAALLEPGF